MTPCLNTSWSGAAPICSLLETEGVLAWDGSGWWRAAARPEAWARAVSKAVLRGAPPCPPWREGTQGAEEPVEGRQDSLFTARPCGRPVAPTPCRAWFLALRGLQPSGGGILEVPEGLSVRNRRAAW